eukprot:1185952-Prorocentrum_minimum.AAC.4
MLERVDRFSVPYHGSDGLVAVSITSVKLTNPIMAVQVSPLDRARRVAHYTEGRQAIWHDYKRLVEAVRNARACAAPSHRQRLSVHAAL